MARADKQAAVAEIVESFNESAGAVLTEYRGLTVKELQELRRSLGANANYAVVKNTLAKLAAKQGSTGRAAISHAPPSVSRRESPEQSSRAARFGSRPGTPYCDSP